MQCPFYLEDPKNALFRAQAGMDIHSGSDDSKLGKYLLKKWLFRVRAHEVKPEEVVCVVGSVPELGKWAAALCVPLQREGETDIWSRVISIPDRHLEYRYCICIIVELGTTVLVRNWETFTPARNLERHMISPTIKDEPEVYGDNASNIRVERGWLNTETTVHIKLSTKPLNLWRSRYENRVVYVKVTPLNLVRHTTEFPKNLPEALDESLSMDAQDVLSYPSHAFTEVAVLNSKDTCFHPQQQFGVQVAGEMIIFQSTVLKPNTTAFVIDLYIYSSRATEGQPPYHAGFSYLLPSALQSSEGKCVLAVTSTKQRPLGEIKLEYLVVRPIVDMTCDMRISYARHWKKSRSGLEVGHRGSGSSYKNEPKNCAEVRENTIASMKTAIEHGADYVEFDVQLSKDLVPIIYHDFHVYVAMKHRKELDQADMLECPLKDLTLEQLRLMKVYHLSEGKSKNQRFFDEDLEEHQPFPTLQQALEVLNPMTGFNIEIKWTMEQMDGTWELQNPIDLNKYIDTILSCVLQFAGDRRIIFSCFNPDICSMIRLKQNKYPVMFLTQGETSKYSPYNDPRCWNIKSAVSFAQLAEILGVNVHTEDILREPKLVADAKESGLVVFCWGDDNADSAVIKYLKELGLHGIIYDKVDEHSTKEVKESIFLMEARESQKDLLRIVAESAVVAPTPQPVVQERILDVEKGRQHLDQISTCTSLDSLETIPDYKP